MLKDNKYYVEIEKRTFIIFTVKRRLFGGADLYGIYYYTLGNGKISTSKRIEFDAIKLGEISESLKGTNEINKISELFKIMSILNNTTWYY